MSNRHIARTRRSVVTGLVALALAVAGLGAIPVLAAEGPAPGSGQREVLTNVHTDVFNARWTGDGLELFGIHGHRPNQISVDPSATIFNLEDLPAARAAVPPGVQWEFIGPQGSPLWIAPMTQNPALIWPGWSTEDVPSGALTGNTVEYRVLDVDGPGDLAIFTTGSFGGPNPPLVATHTGSAPFTWNVPVNSHVHANWAFTALGRYVLTVEVTGTRASDGAPVSSGPVEYAFVVGDVVPDPTETVLSSPASAEAGEPVTLEATVDGPRVSGWVEFSSGGAVLGHAEVERDTVEQGSATFEHTFGEGTYELSAHFVPRFTNDHEPSSSAVAPLEVGEGNGNGNGGPGNGGPGNGGPGNGGPGNGGPGNGGPGNGSPPPPAGSECVALDVLLDDGHVDVAARLSGGQMEILVKDDTGGGAPVWRDPATVGFHLKPEAREQVPPGAQWSFLGSPGASTWQIPQTQQQGILWLGWNTESIDYGQLDGGVTWRLDAVEGPGSVAVYQVNAFGQPVVHFDTDQPLPQQLSLGIPTHAHGNWAFSAEGIYHLTFSYRATLAGGGAVQDTGTIAMAVGDVDLADLCPGGFVPDPSPVGSEPSGTGGDELVEASTGGSGGDPCVPAPLPTGSNRLVLDDGHVDYAARVVDGGLESTVKDDTTGGEPAYRAPGSVVLHLVDAARTTVPGAGFDFLGAPGSTVWQIPQTQQPGILWLGWNTEAIGAAEVSGALTWRLDAVEGPGDLAVYELDSFGQPRVIFSSADGLPDTFTVPVGTHAHGNWSFTAEGFYEVTFTYLAVLPGGGEVSDTARVTFAVGDVDPMEVARAALPELDPDVDYCELPVTGSAVALGLLGLAGALLLTGTLFARSRRRQAPDVAS